MVNIIGLIGLICIVAALLPETIRTLKEGKVRIPYSFLIIYLIGCIFLTAYSFILKDLIFMTLNGISAVESAINLYYKAFPRK